MHVALGRRVVGSNGQQSDLDVAAFADFLESLEIGTVAANLA
jgi:hypothetical protein